MNRMDSTGHQLSGATDASVALYDQAAGELLCMVDDPAATAERAIAEAPEMTMGHVLKAWLHLLGTEPSGRAVALDAVATAATLAADAREQCHTEAARALANGRWREAALRLEDLSARYPLDTLALQVGHQIDFFRGDARMLRDRIARALPAWTPTVPGWHAVLGMHAFGLEETGLYVQAEAQGRACVALQPRDSWGWHAVAHVLEMRNEPREGIAWLRPHRAVWSAGSFLAVHNTWHLALFELELDGQDEALRLFDEAIGGAGSGVVMDLIDASAMLWRLQLRGVDVGDRWSGVADRWALALAQGPGQYAFNDVHAMLAYVGAGREEAQRELLRGLQAAAEGDGDEAMFAREVGLGVAQALQAIAQKRPAEAVFLLRQVRSGAHRFGGSHAQRDLIDLSLIHAAQSADDSHLAAALAAERAALRPRSPLAQRLAQRVPVRAAGPRRN